MDELRHYGIKGQKWGVRRFQDRDGTLTPEGRERYAEQKRKRKRARGMGLIALGEAAVREILEDQEAVIAAETE